jgi:spore coat protein CotH
MRAFAEVRRLTVRPCWRAAAAMLALVTIAGSPSAQTTPDPAAPLFDDSRIEDIQILINRKDWETLKTNFARNTYYPADWRWRDTTVRNVGIRSRGNGSRSGVKPGLRIDFDRYSTRQRFLGLKSVVLRNNTQDPSNIHERVAMLFFGRMAIPSSRELHARLFVNNEYAGLYTIVEALDKDFLTRVFGDNDGFLFAYDYPADAPPYYFAYRGADPANYVPLPFRPETNESDPRPEVIERLVFTINSTDASRFRTAIDEFLDVRALIRFVAVEAFLSEQDGFVGEWGMNNYYLYRPVQNTRFRILPWDKSQAFVYGPSMPIWHNITGTPDSTRNRLLTRLLESADLRELFLDTLLEAARAAAEVVPGSSRGWLEREIDREALQIRDAVYADTTKPFSNEAFEAEIEALRAFARQRPDFVAGEVTRARALSRRF